MSADHCTFSQRLACDDSIQADDLRLPRAITHYFNIRDGLTVFLASQIPPGAGLGSSSSVAVSMIKALAFWSGLDLGPVEVADLACYVEIERLGMPVGKQDQYASAFGGLNYITFSPGGVSVEPLQISAVTRGALERGLMLFFTGASSQSYTILCRQQEAVQQGDEETIRRLDAIKELGLEIRIVLERGDLESFGHLLHRSWMEKRRLAEGITTPFLDQCYQTARENGALGGKVTGAGGGGFLMLYSPVERQEAVTGALKALGLQRFPLAFESQGVDVMQAMPWSRPQMPDALSFINGNGGAGENDLSIFAAPVIGQTQCIM